MRELLLIDIGGRRYGIWKDGILSVKDMPALHRLPLSPACIAGISVIDGRTITLADLPVCIGHAPASAEGKGHILILPGEKITGFLVSGDIASASVPPDAVHPIPEYLRTGVIDTCAILDSVPVPVINVSSLYEHLLKPDLDLPRASFTISRREPEESGKISDARVFTLHGQVFAAPHDGIEDNAAQPEGITGLSLVPRYVRGIAFRNGSLLPVIDLAQRVMGRKAGTSAWMLTADVNGGIFGFLVTEDKGKVPTGDAAISDLPPLARTPWLRAALLNAGEIIPLLDLPALMTVALESPEKAAHAERYIPDQQFLFLFMRQDADVVEFSLLGVRHALPKSEVDGVLPMKPWVHIPEAPEIMIGVAEHDRELLPVLDLAMIFGRRSIVSDDWRMVLVKNGDFRVLVITEKVFGDRRLPRDIQRTVPILLPNNVVYGCYPDGEAVRLILNVHAMAVYFEKSLVKEFLPSLSEEMKQAPSRIVPALLGEEAGAGEDFEEPAAAAASAPLQESEPAAAAVVADEPAAADVESAPTQEPAEVLAEKDGTRSEEQQQQEQQQQEQQENFVEPADEQEALADDSHGEDNTIPPISEASPPAAEGDAASQETEAAEEKGTTVPLEDSVIAPSEHIAEETAKIEEEILPEQVSPAVPETVGITVEEKAIEEKEIQPAHDGIPEVTPQHVRKEPEPEALSEPHHQTVTEPQPEPDPEPVPTLAYHGTASEPSDHTGNRGLIFTAAAIVLGLLLYLLGDFTKPEDQKPAGKAEQAKTEPVQAEVMARTPAAEPAPRLELDVPENRPVTIDVYVIVKGDTLWSISERFTGNPFNYPRIAGENRIADPDLIFPGQQIHLKKK